MSKSTSLAKFFLLPLAHCIFALTLSSSPAHASDPVILHFPAKQSVGKVTFYPNIKALRPEGQVRQAQADMVIPAGSAILAGCQSRLDNDAKADIKRNVS